MHDATFVLGAPMIVFFLKVYFVTDDNTCHVCQNLMFFLSVFRRTKYKKVFSTFFTIIFVIY